MPVPMPYDQAIGLSRAPSRQARQFTRSLGNLDAQSRLEAARIRAAADIQALRADAITYVAKRGLRDVALLTQIEQQLCLVVPMASGRLAAIADTAAISIAEVVSDTAQRLR